MKRQILISIGILILMVSCKEKETQKVAIENNKEIPRQKSINESRKENTVPETVNSTETKSSYYNPTPNIDFENNGNSEIGKINDADGFSNLRKERNSKSEILSKIIENEYFFYQSDMKSNWLKVKDLKGNVGFVHKSRVLKVTNSDLYNMSFTDYDKKTKTEFRKDTIVNINFLEDFFLDNFFENDFNYRKFIPSKSPITYEDTLAVYKDTKTEVTVSFSKSKFNPEEHEIEYNEDFVRKIDGQDFWGTDGGIPREKFEWIRIKEDRMSYSIPKSKLSDLFGPNLGPRYVHITKPNDDRLIIKMSNSDGAGGYAVVFILKEKKLLKRIVYHNF